MTRRFHLEDGVSEGNVVVQVVAFLGAAGLVRPAGGKARGIVVVVRATARTAAIAAALARTVSETREQRDAGLSVPKLLLPSIQVNIRAGELPPPEANGVSYLKIPLNAL